MRDLLRRIFLFAWSVLGCAAGAAAEQTYAVVLQYHHVADDTPKSTSVSPQSFQRQMRYLLDKHYAILPLPELMQHLRSGKKLPDRAVALTFDDANRSVCETVFPLLAKLKIPFTVFVDTDPVDRGYPANCSWDQLRELAQAGVTLANHTGSHSHLVQRAANQNFKEWRTAVLADIERGEQRIHEETGQSHHLLAWPYGEFSEATKEIARNAGYIAFGQQSGPLAAHSDMLELPRFAMSGTVGLDSNAKLLAAKLETLPFPAATINKPDNPLAIDDAIPTLEFILHDANALDSTHNRRRQLNCFDSEGHRISSTWLSDTRFRVRAIRPLPVGRSRYNCTLPASNGRFYWYSSAWIRADKNGQWPD